jgi:hypothetical protein
MDPDFLWHALTGSALITAAVALARLLFDYVWPGHHDDHLAPEHDRQERERRLRHDRDAEARLERILQDRLAEADRRLERSDADLRAERSRTAALERDLLRLQQAYDLLRIEYANLLHLAEAQRAQCPPR